MTDFTKIKYIFIDIDNTLTDSNREVTEYTKEVLSKIVKKGICVVLCTGRNNKYAIDKSILSNASEIVIADNGALIYDYKNNNVIFKKTIDNDVVNYICKKALELDIDCVFNTSNSRYRYYKFNSNDYIKSSNTISNVYDIKEGITQIVINSEDKEKLNKLKEIIDDMGPVVVSNTNLNQIPRRKSYFCDINTAGISKGLAIKYLAKKLGLKKENIMCFGDSMNDISMFYESRYSVAMKNASDDLKKEATHITEYTNNEDGVAHFIEDNIL